MRKAAIIGFRVLQAIGGAFVAANNGAVIADLYPPKEQGRAYGFNAVGWTLGAFCTMTGFMAIAAILSSVRGRVGARHVTP